MILVTYDLLIHTVIMFKLWYGSQYFIGGVNVFVIAYCLYYSQSYGVTIVSLKSQIAKKIFLFLTITVFSYFSQNKKRRASSFSAGNNSFNSAILFPSCKHQLKLQLLMIIFIIY